MGWFLSVLGKIAITQMKPPTLEYEFQAILPICLLYCLIYASKSYGSCNLWFEFVQN